MLALTGMAFMEISGPKRSNEVGAKALAQSSGANEATPEMKKKETGCYVDNVWYPEGAIYPPQEPGRNTLTVVTYVCRGGKWLMQSMSD